MHIEQLTQNFWNLAKVYRRSKEPKYRTSLQNLLQQPYITDKLRSAIQKAIAA